LRKLIAYLLGVFSVFTLGYVFLDPALLLIADWLGPLFGTHILAALTSAFLLFGDPLRFTVLSALWGGVAFLGGLIIRRRVGAVATMVSVFLLFLGIFAASIFGIIQTVSEMGLMEGSQDPFNLLPPFPSGLSLAQLADAPILGRIIEPLQGLLMGGAGDPQALLMGLLTPILIDFAEKFVIVCFAALVGVEVGKRVEKRFAPWSEALRIKLGGKAKPDSAAVAAFTPKAVLPVILLVILMGVSVVPLRANASGGGYFSENLIGFADGRGRGYIASIFLDSEMPVSGVDVTGTEFEGLLAAVLVSQDSILNAVPEMDGMPEGFDVSSLSTLVPPTALIAVYVDTPPEAAAERAEAISSSFSDAFGVGLSQLIAFSPPLDEGEGVPQVSVVVYESSDELRGMMETYLGLLPVERGGIAEVMEEAYRNGRLIPGVVPESADGSAMFAGFINLAALKCYVPLGELDRLNISGLLLPSLDAPLGFSGSVSYWERGVQSPSDAHSFDLLRLLGVDHPVGFSSDADLSNLLLVTVNQTLGTGEAGRPTIKLVTTAPLTDPQFEQMIQEMAGGMTLTVAAPGSTLDSSDFEVTFSALLPLNVQVSKQVTPQATSADGEVQVTVTVKNDDDHTMEDVVLDDGNTVLGYPAISISGSTRETWNALLPGESRTLTYTLRLGPGGVYTLRPATVQYLYAGETFSASSEAAEVRVPQPSAPAFVAGSVAASWEASAEALDTFTGGNGSTILLASTLASLALLAFVEYRGFKKWLAGE